MSEGSRLVMGSNRVIRGAVAGAIVWSGGVAHAGAVRASVVADRAAVAPGEVFTVAVVLEMDEGWHTYWRNPGDSGAPPRIVLTLPEGWEWGGMESVEYPHPVRHAMAGNIVDYIYEGHVALMAPVRVGEGETIGESREIGVAVEWLECDADRCVPGSATLRLGVETASESREGDGSAMIASQRLKAPREWGSGDVRTAWDGEWLVIRVGSDGGEVRSAVFFPYSAGEGSLAPADDGVRDWRARAGEVRVRYEAAEVAGGGEVHGNLVVDRASGEREVWEVRARGGAGE